MSYARFNVHRYDRFYEDGKYNYSFQAAYLSPFVAAVRDERGEMNSVSQRHGLSISDMCRDIADNRNVEYLKVLFRFWSAGHPRYLELQQKLNEHDSLEWLFEAFHAMFYDVEKFWSVYGDD